MTMPYRPTNCDVPGAAQHGQGSDALGARRATARALVVVALLSERQEFQVLQADDARAAGKRIGVDIEVVFADNDGLTPIQQLFRCIRAPAAGRPNTIILEAIDALGHPSVALAAAQQGVGWVLLTSHPQYLDELRHQYPGVPIASVTVDDEEVGRIQAQQFRALLPGGGNMIYLSGPTSSAGALLRREAMERSIASSKIKVEKTLRADWTTPDAERVTLSWLRSLPATQPRPGLFGVQNDAMALGARNAIQALRPEWLSVPITGCDGLPNGGQLWVNNKVLAATVIKPPPTGVAVDLVGRALRGERIAG